MATDLLVGNGRDWGLRAALSSMGVSPNMKILVRLLTALLFASVAFASVPSAQATIAGDTQGCTPGYWKQSQHFDSWQEASPSSLFTTKFKIGTPTVDPLNGLTFLQALQGGGGPDLVGARKILARAATAAWLNAAYDAPDGSAMFFPWRRATASAFGRPALVPTVRAAITGTDRAAMLSLAAWLDADNNLGCPLN